MRLNETERVKSQCDYPIPFKLQVIRQIEGGEMTYIQAQRYYGIQGKSTVWFGFGNMVPRTGIIH